MVVRRGGRPAQGGAEGRGVELLDGRGVGLDHVVPLHRQLLRQHVVLHAERLCCTITPHTHAAAQMG